MRLYTNNMLQQQFSKAPAQITADIPSKIYLDMTPDCNLYCIMCRESLENSGRIMKIGLFKRIIDETRDGVTSYSMFNSGESLLLPDFKERLKYVSGRKLPETVIDLSTNGMLLTEDTGKYLVDFDVEVHISFDGSNAGIFEKIRRGSDFNKICKNIEQIASVAARMNPFRAPGIAVSVQKDNWHDLVNIVTVGHNLGVKRVSMWPVKGPTRCRLAPDKDVVGKIAEAIHCAEDNGMAVDMYPVRLGDYIWNGREYVAVNGSLLDKSCNAPFTCSGISWDGQVYLCCNYGARVDNMSDKSFREVWLGEKYNSLRRQVNQDATMPEICRECFWVNRY